jgi:hypothetical protein
MPSILNIEITEEHIGKPVIYIPNHYNGDPAQCESGTISSFNDTYIFVKFKGPNGQACKGENLIWSI